MQKDGLPFGTIDIPTRGYPVITTNSITENCTIQIKSSYLIQEHNPIIAYAKSDYSESGAVNEGDPIELSANNNWKYIWEALPQTNEDGKEFYYYTVKEVTPVNGYTVSYSNNTGIQNGEIVVTNKKQPPKYELPETGGSGTGGIRLGGLLLMAGALVGGCMLRRKREGRLS